MRVYIISNSVEKIIDIITVKIKIKMEKKKKKKEKRMQKKGGNVE